MDEIEQKASKENKIYSVGSIVQLLKNAKLDLGPAYQRDVVWKLPQQRCLIDTIINDLDMPKLYWFEKGKNFFEVVDGKQRITSMSRFMNNEFTLDSEPYKGILYKDLPVDVQTRINDFKVVVMQLSGDRWDEDMVTDMFLRLQQGTPLNPAEKRRALSGKLGKLADDLVKLKVFAENCSIPAQRFGRQDAAAKIIHLALGNHNIKAKAIEATFKNKHLDEDHPKIKDVKKALLILSRGFKGRGLFFKKYSILSITTAIAELLDQYSFTDMEDKVADVLQSTDAKRRANDSNPQLTEEGLELTKLTAAARSDRDDDILFRKQFFRKIIISSGIVPISQRRLFTSEEKAAVYFRDNKVCKKCDDPLKITECEIDHIIPFSRGGLTNLDNAQLLCIKCNRSKSND